MGPEVITLEQVRLLESKITKTIEFIKKVTGDNTILKGKLDSYQKRIEELEVLIQGFREDQNRIEDTILSALDRLNQFEDAVESKITEAKKDGALVEPAPSAETSDDLDSPPEQPEELEKNSESGELDIF